MPNWQPYCTQSLQRLQTVKWVWNSIRQSCYLIGHTWIPISLPLYCVFILHCIWHIIAYFPKFKDITWPLTPKIRVPGLSCGIVCISRFDAYQHVTDRQTHDDSIYHASIADSIEIPSGVVTRLGQRICALDKDVDACVLQESCSVLLGVHIGATWQIQLKDCAQ